MGHALKVVAGIWLAAIASLATFGCGTSARPTSGVGDVASGHTTGAHGGILVPIGRDSYHAEAVFEKNGAVRLYVLGQDPARVQEADAQELTASLTPEGSTESDTVIFRPEPQPGDTNGKTSLFTATLPADLAGQPVRVTLNSININGERFRVVFAIARPDGHADSEMPAKKGSDEEQQLFLTPGGLYTAADVAANGNTVPTVKYQGIRARHDDNPKSGERVCPISKTKANPKFTWVIGGKTFEFCCVPCIEEFVVLAKEKPGEVKDPAEYIKR